MRTYVAAKLHRIRVTDKSLDYNGSVGIDRSLMGLVGIAPYEQVHVVNVTTGERWVTYALPLDRPRAFTLNGGGARLGEVGDVCVVMTYRTTAHEFGSAKVITFDDGNVIDEVFEYAP